MRLTFTFWGYRGRKSRDFFVNVKYQHSGDIVAALRCRAEVQLATSMAGVRNPNDEVANPPFNLDGEQQDFLEHNDHQGCQKKIA